VSEESQRATSGPEGNRAGAVGAALPQRAKRRIGARLAGALKRQDWVAVAIELLVVVIGVLVALELNQWSERRQTRALEHAYLLRLKGDMQMEQEETDRFTGYAHDRLAAVSLLDALTSNPLMPLKDPRAIVCEQSCALSQRSAGGRSRPFTTFRMMN